MCGFCGELRFDGGPVQLGPLSGMLGVLAPRGPDGAGAWQHDSVALGHRRLKIIDLSDRSAQPFEDRALGIALVFNGAIYNYRELREELRAKGYAFVSEGDTEVIAKAWHAWGEDALHRFRGMYAFVLWEGATGRVVLVRDHLGIKPLYYARVPGGLRFASSLPALARSGGVSTDIDPVALQHYMTFHAVVPAPLTILEGVRKVEPATIVEIAPDGGMTSRRYWDLTFPDDGPRRDPREWQEEVLVALRTAVDRRLVADVPVGVLLSGGLDSSLIVGLLAEAGQQGLRTFSVGFEAHGGEEGDEFRYSDAVAETFGTEHTKIRVPDAELLEHLDDCIGAMSEPMVSHDNVGFYLLSREVARHVKVVQSGQGADEVFGGYHWYPPLLESTDPLEDYARVFFDRGREELEKVLHPRFHGNDHPRELVARHFARPGAGNAVDKALRIDTTVMLVEDPVKRVDNMTMAWGLEARVPFLDRDLVELAARVPAPLKVGQGGKHVLKEVARSVLPDVVIDRPKGYFPVPALKYPKGRVLELIREALHDGRARDRALFAPDHVERLLDDPTGQITPLGGSKLWQVGLLELWLQKQGI